MTHPLREALQWIVEYCSSEQSPEYVLDHILDRTREALAACPESPRDAILATLREKVKAYEHYDDYAARYEAVHDLAHFVRDNLDAICAGPSRDDAVMAERERCATIAANFFPRAHTYASENADVYLAQDDACARIAAAIRSRPAPASGGETR